MLLAKYQRIIWASIIVFSFILLLFLRSLVQKTINYLLNCLQIEYDHPGDDSLELEKNKHSEYQGPLFESQELEYSNIQKRYGLLEVFKAQEDSSTIGSVSPLKKLQRAVKRIKVMNTLQGIYNKKQRDFMYEECLNIDANFDYRPTQEVSIFDASQRLMSEQDKFIPKRAGSVNSRDKDDIFQTTLNHEKESGSPSNHSKLEKVEPIERSFLLKKNTSDTEIYLGDSSSVPHLEAFLPCPDQENYNPLAWPEPFLEKLGYFFLLPVNLIFFFLFPNILEPTNKPKVVISFCMLTLCTLVLVFVLAAIEYSLYAQYYFKPYLLSLINAAVFIWK